MNPEQRIQILNQMQSFMYDPNNEKVVHDIRDKDIALFVGNTRDGKSTTVNFVIGNPLKSVPVKRKFKITHANAQFNGPAIGMGSVSETTVPSAWNSSKISGMIVDAPGFDDNRGEAQDVANAFYIKEIITNARTIKFVLISDINSITGDNISQFIRLMDKVHLMLPQSQNLHHGMSIVFTKDDGDTTKDEIRQELRDKIINQPGIQVKNRPLVQYFADNPNHIVIVKMPISERMLDHNDGIFTDLIHVIEAQTAKLPKESLAAVTPGLSDRSRSFLLESRAQLLELREFDTIVQGVQSTYAAQRLQPLEVSFGAVAEGESIKQRLAVVENELTQFLQSPQNLRDWLVRLSNLVPSMGQLKEVDKIYTKLRFVSFVDQILGMGPSDIFFAKIRAMLDNLRNACIRAQAMARDRIAQIVAAEAEARRREQELAAQQEQARLAELRRQQEEQQRQIELIQQQIAQQQHHKRRRKCVLQ